MKTRFKDLTIKTLKTSTSFVLLVPAAIALQACSTSNGPQSEFERLVAAGDADLGDYGDEYNAGQMQYARGEEMKRRAERDLEQARDRQREARRDIDEAREQIEEAEELMERAAERMERAESQYRQSDATVEITNE